MRRTEREPVLLLGSNHSEQSNDDKDKCGGFAAGLAVGWVAANQWLLLRRLLGAASAFPTMVAKREANWVLGSVHGSDMPGVLEPLVGTPVVGWMCLMCWR